MIFGDSQGGDMIIIETKNNVYVGGDSRAIRIAEHLTRYGYRKVRSMLCIGGKRRMVDKYIK
jgi:hypothetical protein